VPFCEHRDSVVVPAGEREAEALLSYSHMSLCEHLGVRRETVNSIEPQVYTVPSCETETE